VSAVLGVPTVVRTKTWLAFDVRVSDALTAALDRGSGELALRRLPGYDRCVRSSSPEAGLPPELVVRTSELPSRSERGQIQLCKRA
jgi:hypothetical protein